MSVEVQPKSYLQLLLCKKLKEVGKCQQLLRIRKSIYISFVKAISSLRATTISSNLLALVQKIEL